MWKCPDCATPQLCAAEGFNCGHDKTLTVGWIIKWRSYFGEKTGKVVGEWRDAERLIGYDVSEQGASTQGFPGLARPVLVSPRDVIEVVSREA